jgi:large subunit ribosomal protein L34
MVTKRTWQPKKRRRIRVHGFMKRMSTRGGRKVLQARRARGRKELTVQKHYAINQ